MSLIFLSNDLQSPDKREKLRLPLQFITFAIRKGTMYKHTKNRKEGFVTQEAKTKFNSVVYGSVWACEHFSFYISIIDAYHRCSLGILNKNHSVDLEHRVKRSVTPISFDSLEELAYLNYKEKEPFDAYCYEGNINHPDITKRIWCPSRQDKRIIDGIHPKAFIGVYKEVKDERQQRV